MEAPEKLADLEWARETYAELEACCLALFPGDEGAALQARNLWWQALDRDQLVQLLTLLQWGSSGEGQGQLVDDPAVVADPAPDVEARRRP